MASLTCLLLVLITLFLNKLLTIRIPSQLIPWSASNTQLHSMKSLNNLLLVIAHLSGPILALDISVLLLFLGTGLARICIIPHYRCLVDWLTRLIELFSACLLLMLVVAQTLGSHDLRICPILGLVTVPGVVVLAVIVDQGWQYQLMRKFENGRIRMEIEMEYALYLLIQMNRVAMGSDDNSHYAMSNVLYLADVHNRTC